MPNLKAKNDLESVVATLRRVSASVKQQMTLPSEERTYLCHQVSGYESIEDGVIQVYFSQVSDSTIAFLQEEIRGYPDDGLLDQFLLATSERALGVLRYKAEQMIYPVLLDRLKAE